MSACFSLLRLTSVSDEMKVYLLYLALTQKSTARHPSPAAHSIYASESLSRCQCSLNTLHVSLEDLSSSPDSNSVTAMRVFKHSRITEDSCSAAHGQIQLQFLVQRCCWGEGKRAGWGRGRM